MTLEQDPSFPHGMSISPNSSPKWTENREAILFGIRRLAKIEAPADADQAQSGEEKPDLVIWNWQDKRLPTQQQVDEAQDKNF